MERMQIFILNFKFLLFAKFDWAIYEEAKMRFNALNSH